MSRKLSGTPKWLITITALTVLLSIPSVILFVVPIAIASFLAFKAKGKGLNALTVWCKTFLYSFGAGFLILAALAIAFPSVFKAPEPVASVAPEQQKPKCEAALGNIWTGIKLYRDKDCLEPFATILGRKQGKDGEQEQVILRFDTGDLEYKNRSAVTQQAFVLSNDPAIAQMQLKEF